MMPSFNDLDLINKDEKITKVEFEDAQQKRMTKRTEDGRLLRNAGNAPMFDTVDLGKSGYINAKEFRTHQLANRKGAGRGMNR